MARNNKIVGIILAAGKGTRINSKSVNKVVYPFNKKPMILYGVDLFEQLTSSIIVVVGAYEESVKEVLDGRKNVHYAFQKLRLGTGHAVRLAVRHLHSNPPALVLVGMGDHMMFYKKKTIQKLIDLHLKENAVATFISTKYHDPNSLAWGRVERTKKGKVLDIVEQKDATPQQRKIKELNAALYCFNYSFLTAAVNLLMKSPVTGEYYLTDVIKIARLLDLPVFAMPVHFREVGIGINRHEELEESQRLYKRFRTP